MPPPQLAAESSLHWSYFGQVERAQRIVTLHDILKLAGALGVDPGGVGPRLARVGLKERG